MAKRTVWWHVGPDALGTSFLPRALAAAAPALARRGFRTPRLAEAAEADLELRRAYATAGLGPVDVDGAWKELEDRIWREKGTWLLSTPKVFLADGDRVRLARDGLRGIRLNLVWFGEPAGDTEAWAQPLHPDRVHVLDPSGGPLHVWQGFLQLAGVADPPLFPTSELTLAT